MASKAATNIATTRPRGADAARAAAEQRLAALAGLIRVCRLCRDAPQGAALPHEPRPVFQVSASARLLISGQAPGTRVHASGRPFTDPSGERLRDWMGIAPDVFYDAARVAIVPMGLCFPGLDGNGGDLPPRPECAPTWRAQLIAALPRVELILLVGQYAQRWHLGGASGKGARPTLTATVADWRGILERTPAGAARLLPLPHPSWRNNGWLRAHPWFADELLPVLRAEVARLTTG
jgi:uracil-DNA glycosylase